MIQGMDRETGRPLSGIAYLIQCIRDVLTTRKGSRRERMEYGSELPALVDLPVTRAWISTAQAEVASALGRWVADLKLERVQVISVINGRVTMRLRGSYLDQPFDQELTV